MEVEPTAIVADWGTYISKFGFAGNDKPRWWYLTIAGEPKFQEMMNGVDVKEFYLGDDVKLMRKELNVTYPVIDGYVKDWDIMEKMLNFVILEGLKSSPEDHPILFTESPFNSDENRLSLWEVMFQGLNAPWFYVQKQGVLALYATEKTNGLVLSSGEGISNVIPIYEGFAVPHAIQMINISGSDVTEYLRRLITERGYKVSSVVRIIYPTPGKGIYKPENFAKFFSKSIPPYPCNYFRENRFKKIVQLMNIWMSLF